ncbi:MAG: VOC family protein [bacterium]
MSEKNNNIIGSIGWVDLTIPNASELREFYKNVVGWKSEGLSMGEYEDFVMISPSDNQPKAGVCHKRGGNSEFPSVWMVYFTVKNIDDSIRLVKESGGKILVDIKIMDGYGKYCVIEDPAGAVCALFENI